MTFLERITSAVAESGPLCVGIDPSADVLAAWGLADDARGAREVGMRVVDACRGRIAIVKPQVAFFERHGAAGFAALEEVLAAARATGLTVIADAKRGDIGSTAEGYAEAWLRPGSPLEADAVTAAPYLGVGALAPLLALAAESGKGVLVLAATSNPEAAVTQRAVRADGRSLAAGVVADLRAAVAPGAGGVVLGGTVRLGDYGIGAADLDGLVALAPGFGTQGARLGDLRTLFGDAVVVPSVSRSVLTVGPAGLAEAIDAARGELGAAA